MTSNLHEFSVNDLKTRLDPQGRVARRENPKKELEILQNTSRTSHDMNYSLTTKISDSEKLTKNWFKMVLLDPEIHDLHLITPFSASKPGAHRQTHGRTHMDFDVSPTQ